jgi:hypothetical protein
MCHCTSEMGIRLPPTFPDQSKVVTALAAGLRRVVVAAAWRGVRRQQTGWRFVQLKVISMLDNIFEGVIIISHLLMETGEISMAGRDVKKLSVKRGSAGGASKCAADAAKCAASSAKCATTAAKCAANAAKCAADAKRATK